MASVEGEPVVSGGGERRAVERTVGKFLGHFHEADSGQSVEPCWQLCLTSRLCTRGAELASGEGA